MMTPEMLTDHSLVDLLLNRKTRAELLAEIQQETGTYLPLRNRYYEVALKCSATAIQIEQVIEEMIDSCSTPEEFISPFIFHPHVPHDLLYRLLDRQICISDLAHRTGPRELLERLAEEFAYSEAITTLLLDYYGASKSDDAAFVDFVSRHREDPMLRWNVCNNPVLPEHKRRLAMERIQVKK